MENLDLKLLEQIATGLKEAGISLKIKEESVCTYKKQFDRSTQEHFGMASGVGFIFKEVLTHRIFCVEQYDKENELKKYSVKITDLHGATLKQYDLDTRFGPHFHLFKNGQKQPQHIRSSRDFDEVISDLIKIINSKS